MMTGIKRQLGGACPSLLVTLPLPTLSFGLLLLGLIVAGCASPSVNPPQARANTGYVDFHADSSGLCWEVARFNERAQQYQRIFSELKPPPAGILRLALAPGRHRLRVTLLNRVVIQPAELDVEVPDGKIVPVRVTLSPAGTTQVQTKEENRGGTAKGRFGRRTIIGSTESVMYSISAVAHLPVAYQVKERMSYAR